MQVMRAKITIAVALLIVILVTCVIYYRINDRHKQVLAILSNIVQNDVVNVKNPLLQLPSGKAHLFSNETIDDCITKERVVRIIANFRELGLVPFSAAYVKQSRENISNVDVSRQKAFVNIFKKRVWGQGADVSSAGLQVSGGGSSLHSAQEMSASLHVIINDLKEMLGLKTIRLLDIPCGDFQWMYRFLQTRNDVVYTGMDIVPNLINHHNKKFSDKPWRFKLHDAVKTPLRESFDVVISRHVLQHLPNSDVLKMLSHISGSGSKYLLATTFPNERKVADLNHAGEFRPLNLQLAPISLPPPLCLHKDGPQVTGGYLGLWKFPLNQLTSCSSSRVKSYNFQGASLFACF